MRARICVTCLRLDSGLGDGMGGARADDAPGE